MHLQFFTAKRYLLLTTINRFGSFHPDNEIKLPQVSGLALLYCEGSELRSSEQVSSNLKVKRKEIVHFQERRPGWIVMFSAQLLLRRSSVLLRRSMHTLHLQQPVAPTTIHDPTMLAPRMFYITELLPLSWLESAIWNMSSTLKKRRAKMNKHKLRKRRKKLRLQSK